MDKCKGCNNGLKVCLAKHYDHLLNQCPCRDCLVKMMCNDLCHERIEAYANITNNDLIKEYEMNPNRSRIQQRNDNEL